MLPPDLARNSENTNVHYPEGHIELLQVCPLRQGFSQEEVDAPLWAPAIFSSPVQFLLVRQNLNFPLVNSSTFSPCGISRTHIILQPFIWAHDPALANQTLLLQATVIGSGKGTWLNLGQWGWSLKLLVGCMQLGAGEGHALSIGFAKLLRRGSWSYWWLPLYHLERKQSSWRMSQETERNKSLIE